MDRPDWRRTEYDFTQYLLSSGRSPNTVQTYVSNLKMFWLWCNPRELTPYEAGVPALRAYITDRLAERSSERVHNDLAALKHFYKWLIVDHLRDDDPTTTLSVKRRKSLPTPPLEEMDINALLAACNKERDKLIILVLATTGMRISELADMRCEDIDWRNGCIKIRGKGDKERYVDPPHDVMGRLHAFLGMFPEGGVWRSRQATDLSANQIRKNLYDIALKAGVDHVHPHRFRSTFAVTYMEEKSDIEALSGVLGHESVVTTQRYTQATKIRRGREQMRSLSLASRLRG